MYSRESKAIKGSTFRLVTSHSPYNIKDLTCSYFFEFIKPVGEKDKIRGLSSILSLFRIEFNKFNNTRAQMLDSIDHMTLRSL